LHDQKRAKARAKEDVYKKTTVTDLKSPEEHKNNQQFESYY
jgi:hypothetical protein